MDKSNRRKRDIRKYTPKYILTAILARLGAVDSTEMSTALQGYHSKLNFDESVAVLGECFRHFTGEELEPEHPKTFNQKIQWLKLFDSTPLKTKLADKYLVREWVKETIGEEYLIPLVGGPWYSAKDIDFDALPEKFVLKANHSSGMNIVVTDKSSLDRKKIKKQCSKWLKKNYGLWEYMELHYRDIRPCIIAEQYMENETGDLPDYKFYCFNGKPTYIQLISGRRDETLMTYVDTDWKDAGFTCKHYYGKMEELPPRPKQLDKALELARKLSSGFAFVRVDLYMLGDSTIYFGEMTFTPASGVRPWLPESANEMLGDMIELPEKYHYFK